jgi:dihydroorotase
MSKIIFIGGQIVDIDGARSGDVEIDSESGTITGIGEGLDISTADEVIDIAGCIVAPGLVDLHAHLRQPGDEAAETVASASAAAARGGYTAIVAMPDTEPCADGPAAIADLLSLAESATCEIVPAGALSVGRAGEMLAPLAEMVELGVHIFTDNSPGVQNPRFMRRALEYLASIDSPDGESLIIGQHAEVAALSDGGVMHEGRQSTVLGMEGKPAEAEEIQVMRDIALGRMTATPIHFQHLSTAGSIAMVRAAKAGGVQVTAAVAPYSFTFTDADCATFDPIFKVEPPLRSAGDVEALKAGLADGSIDVISSGHAPCTPDRKELPFDQAATGSIGLETVLGVALTELELPMEQVLAATSWRPAKIAGVFPRHGGPVTAGAPANLCVIDPDARWTVSGTDSASRAKNSIFEGKDLKGRVRHTVFSGRLVVKDSAILQGAM